MPYEMAKELGVGFCIFGTNRVGYDMGCENNDRRVI
jgi:hypothetical protein